MLSSKIEIALSILLTVIIVFILPDTFSISTATCYIYLGVLMILILFYTNMKSMYIGIKLKKLVQAEEYKNAHKYLDYCIKKNETWMWLKYEKTVLSALSGDFYNFELYLDKKIKKRGQTFKKYEPLIVACQELIDYLIRGKKSSIKHLNPKSDLDKIRWLLMEEKNKSKSETFKYASDLYNSSIPLFKSFASLILSQEYKKEGNQEKMVFYTKEAQKNAPSQEVEYYIMQYQSGDGSMIEH